MVSVLLLATVAALLAVAGAALYTVISERSGEREKVHEHFERIARVGAPQLGRRHQQQLPLVEWAEGRLRRAGIEPQRWQAVAVPFVVVFVCGSAALARGPVGAALALVMLAVLLHGFLVWRANKRNEQILEQLPGFLDHAVRAVQTGSSLPNAIVAATAECEDPVRGVFARVVWQTRLGVSLEDSLDQAATLHSLRELRILALTVRVSQRYGGSVREILTSIVTMIRQRERTRREFKAMTGETRLSAMILAALPATIAVYVMVVNPDYLDRMISDPAGVIALYISGGLELMGSLVLWRMVKSV